MHAPALRRAAFVTLSVPFGHRTVTHRLSLRSPQPLAARIADLVRSFANSRGISPLAVEYDLSYRA